MIVSDLVAALECGILPVAVHTSAGYVDRTTCLDWYAQGMKAEDAQALCTVEQAVSVIRQLQERVSELEKRIEL